MQLTKGAIGNLINRYKAVLKKCHLLNVFGSLAVAGMLVMGGAAAAGAAETTDKVLSEDISTSVVVSAGNSVNLDLNGYNILLRAIPTHCLSTAMSPSPTASVPAKSKGDLTALLSMVAVFSDLKAASSI